jgi:hypothetical protein
LVDTRLEVLFGSTDVGGEVEGAESALLGGFAQLVGLKDFMEGGAEGDVGCGCATEAQEGADELEAEREVLTGGDEAHGSDCDLHGGVDEWA